MSLYKEIDGVFDREIEQAEMRLQYFKEHKNLMNDTLSKLAELEVRIKQLEMKIKKS